MNSHEIENAYPRMESTRLVLRALKMEDADFIFREWGDPQVTHYMRDEQPLKSRQEAVEMLLPLQSPDLMPDFKWWGIELKDEGQLIGTCGYCRWDKQHHRAEIGYDLWPDYWGKGIMPEALQALISFGFKNMDLNRIEATTHIENQRSQKVLAKLGFQKEGLLREYYCRDGIYNDQYQFSLLIRDWQKTNSL
jgi:[ribosomal protein S5]-alanine N-acetyltransferase